MNHAQDIVIPLMHTEENATIDREQIDDIGVNGADSLRDFRAKYLCETLPSHDIFLAFQ